MIVKVIWITLTTLAVIFIARFLEKKWPIGPNLPHPEVMADWKAGLVSLLLPGLLGPLVMLPVSAAIVGAAGGGGFIRLPMEGGWYFVSLIAFVLIVDFYGYWQHRLEHSVPFLWAMHSFHHSTNAVTLVTGARHYWFEKFIIGTFFPILPILFYIPTDMAFIIGIINFLPNGCSHLNVRFRMGRAITWINSPQWHRIHHSMQPEHFNKNFSGGLPLWDIIFGTAYIPGPDEYPETGLVPSEHVDIIDSIIWPFRHLRSRAVRSADELVSDRSLDGAR